MLMETWRGLNMTDPVAIFYDDASPYGQVKCPTCSTQFPVKQHQNKGAGYAKAKMSSLKDEQINLLTWWISSKYWNEQMEKATAVNRFKAAGGFIGDPDSRFSELVGLELLDMVKNGNSVSYVINMGNVTRVLSNEGRLQS